LRAFFAPPTRAEVSDLAYYFPASRSVPAYDRRRFFFAYLARDMLW
jgi:hypothetical protein